MNDQWLDAANPADIEALAACLLDGRVRVASSSSDLAAAGFGPGAEAFLAGLKGTEARVVGWMLRRLANERRRADDRFARTATLVWSGMSEDSHPLRDTRAVLDGLFARAERHVLISTFVVYNGRNLFAALGERLRKRPEIQVELFVNLAWDDETPREPVAAVNAFLDAFARSHWPEGVALPAMYFDPESLTTEAKRTTLHAKCAVIDRRWALVTSANFTEAAQDRNIEAGVLLDHPQLADQLVARFHSLRDGGRLRRMR